MRCEKCDTELSNDYYLKVCDSCLRKEGTGKSTSKVLARFQVFKWVAPIVGLAYLYLIYSGILRSPLHVIPLFVSWCMVSVFVTGFVFMLFNRSR
jgi:hypothetical protein